MQYSADYYPAWPNDKPTSVYWWKKASKIKISFFVAHMNQLFELMKRTWTCQQKTMCHEAHVGYVLVAEAKPWCCCSAADGLGESGIHTSLKTAQWNMHTMSPVKFGEYQPLPNILDAGGWHLFRTKAKMMVNELLRKLASFGQKSHDS